MLRQRPSPAARTRRAGPRKTRRGGHSAVDPQPRLQQHHLHAGGRRMDHPHHGPRPVHLVRRRDSGKFQKAVYARLRQFQHHGDTAAGNLRRRSVRRRPSARKRRLHAAPHRRVVGCVVQPLESQTGARRTVQIGARPLRTQRRTYVPPEKSGFARTQQAGDRSRGERSQPTQGGARNSPNG